MVRKDCWEKVPLLLNVFLLVIFFSASLYAEEPQTLVSAGPSWDRFTNKDGSGLYHDLIREIFSGYTIQHLYVPTVQANKMVANGRADIKMCETKEIESLVLAKLPMYENDFYALYIKKNEQADEPISLENKRLVWRDGYYSQDDFSVPITFTEVRNGSSALEMIIYGRADFYIDDLSLIEQSFEDLGKEFDRQLFGLKIAGTRKYYPVFADTEHGNMLKTHYEQEIKRLLTEGTLQHIYERYGFRAPNFQ